MKTGWLVKIAIGAAGLATLGIPRAYAQAEIDPDHFELSNTEAFQAPHASMNQQATQLRYDGSAALGHADCVADKLLQSKCAGTAKSDGKTATLSAKRDGQTPRIGRDAQGQTKKLYATSDWTPAPARRLDARGTDPNRPK
jgi:hypothetical protein